MEMKPVYLGQFMNECENDVDKIYLLGVLGRVLFEFADCDDLDDFRNGLEALKYARFIFDYGILIQKLEKCTHSVLCQGLNGIVELQTIASKVCGFFCKFISLESSCDCECMINTCPRIFKNSYRPSAHFAVNYLHRFNNLYSTIEKLEKIRDDFRSGTKYSCSVAVIQSSGTGKTRSFIEIAQKIPSIYICNGDPGEKSSFPPVTPLIIDHLKFAFNRDKFPINDLHVANRSAAFICACVVVTRSAWSSVEGKLGDDDTWEKFINSQFKNCFWLDFIDIIDSIEGMINKIVNPYEFKLRTWDDWENSVSSVTDIFLRGLKSRLPLNFMIIIDEAHYLSEYKAGTCCLSVLEHLHRASRLMCANLGGVLALIDSQPFLEFFKALKACSIQQSFIHDLVTYDLDYDPNLAVDVETASSPKFMAKMGRPIWYSANKTEYSIFMDDIKVTYPMAKLLMINSIRCWDDITFTSERALAILCSRTTLGVGPFTSISQNLVSNHMAILDYYSASSSEAFIHYPSDPILAWAAKTIMGNLTSSQWNSIIDILRKLFCRENIYLRERGRIVAQLLCLHSADVGGGRLREHLFVRDWVDSLLGRRNGCDAGDTEGKFYRTDELLYSFISGANRGILDGMMYLTHFVKVSNYCPNRQDLVEIIKRGCGIVCENSPYGLDLIIPVVLPYSECLKQKYHHQKSNGLSEFKSIRADSIIFPNRPECLSGNFSKNNWYQNDRISQFSESFKKELLRRLSRNVEKIVYCEKSTLNASSFTANDKYNFSESKKFESSKENFPISAENMSYILIRVQNVIGGSSDVLKKLELQASGTVENEGTVRPHMIIDILFKFGDENLSDIKRTERPDKFQKIDSALEFTLINPHHRLENINLREGFDSLFDSWGALLEYGEKSSGYSMFNDLTNMPLTYCSDYRSLISKESKRT